MHIIHKKNFMLMTSLMLTQRDNKYILLYSCLIEISSVFTIIEKLTRISLSNGTYVLSPWWHRQWRHSVTANFGKSAISDCIFISIYSFIHSLLLAKIFNFGKYVRLTVCLFVCLSVCLSVSSSIQVRVFHICLPNLTQICIDITWPCL